MEIETQILDLSCINLILNIFFCYDINQIMNHNNSQQGYNFFYKQNDPFSLTIVKSPKQIQTYLFMEVKFIWVVDTGAKMSIQPKQIQSQADASILFVSSIKQAKFYIDKQKDVRVVLICNKYLVDQLMDTFQAMVKSFKIIFYGNIKIQLKKMNHEIKPVQVDTEEQVIAQIKNNKRFYRKTDYYNFISLQKQVLDTNILMKTMQAMIKQETSTRQLLQQFKQLAGMCYPKQKDKINHFVAQYQSKNHLDYRLAVEWYTKQGFLFHFMNHMLRICKNPTYLYIIQPYFYDLFNAIRHLYREQQIQKYRQTQEGPVSYRKFTCYRGVELLSKEIKFFQQHKNLAILNLGFMSTSRNIKIAEAYMKNAIYEIQVDDQMKNQDIDYGFADLSKYSHGHGQQEILFNPLNSFKVIDFVLCDQEHKIYRIKLKYGEVARVLARQNQSLSEQERKYKQIGQFQKEQNKIINNMGDVLIQKGLNLQGCEQYCEKFLEISNKYSNKQTVAEAQRIKAQISANKN